MRQLTLIVLLIGVFLASSVQSESVHQLLLVQLARRREERHEAGDRSTWILRPTPAQATSRGQEHLLLDGHQSRRTGMNE